MNVIFVLHSKKAFFDVLEGVTSKNCSHARLTCLTPLFCFTITLNILVMLLKISQVFIREYHYLYLLLCCIFEKKYMTFCRIFEIRYTQWNNEVPFLYLLPSFDP